MGTRAARVVYKLYLSVLTLAVAATAVLFLAYIVATIHDGFEIRSVRQCLDRVSGDARSARAKETKAREGAVAAYPEVMKYAKWENLDEYSDFAVQVYASEKPGSESECRARIVGTKIYYKGLWGSGYEGTPILQRNGLLLWFVAISFVTSLALVALRRWLAWLTA